MKLRVIEEESFEITFGGMKEIMKRSYSEERGCVRLNISALLTSFDSTSLCEVILPSSKLLSSWFLANWLIG